MRFNSYEELISFIEREIAKAPNFYSLKNALHNVKQGQVNGCRFSAGIVDDWQPALMLAAREGNLKMLDLFINEEAGHVSKFCTALTASVFRDPNHTCLPYLLANDDEVRASQLDELMLCICKGDTEGAKRIILSDIPLTTDVHRNTALMYAAAMGNAEIVKLLIEHRGEECLRKVGFTHEVRTALMYAIELGKTDCIKLLIDKETGIQDSWKTSALMIATTCGNEEAVNMLKDREAGMQDWDDKTALMHAIELGKTDYIKLLIDKEAGIQDITGRTALMKGIIHGHAEHVHPLIEKEAGKQDQHGRTALMYAVGRVVPRDTILDLARHEINIKDNEGRSVLYYAESKYMRGILLEVAKEMGYKFICNDIPFGSSLDILSKKLPVKDAEQKLKEVDQAVIKEIETALNDAIWSEPIGIDVIKEQLTKFSALFPDIDLTETITEMSTFQYYEECQSCVICLDSNKSIKRVCSNCKSTYVCDNCANVDQIMVSCPTCRGEIGEHDIQFVE